LSSAAHSGLPDLDRRLRRSLLALDAYVTVSAGQ
jgi:hypothetical protein